MNNPPRHLGLRHLALICQHMDACLHFYQTLLGLKIVWQPDPDNIYLSSGDDNLALHKAPDDFNPADGQRLDHLGFFMKEKTDVDHWHQFLMDNGVEVGKPKDHRDGTRSFYCKDPEGNTVQMIWMG